MKSEDLHRVAVIPVQWCQTDRVDVHRHSRHDRYDDDDVTHDVTRPIASSSASTVRSSLRVWAYTHYCTVSASISEARTCLASDHVTISQSATLTARRPNWVNLSNQHWMCEYKGTDYGGLGLDDPINISWTILCFDTLSVHLKIQIMKCLTYNPMSYSLLLVIGYWNGVSWAVIMGIGKFLHC